MRVMFAECLKRRIPVTLLYSVRRAEDAAFLPEFKEVGVHASCRGLLPHLAPALLWMPHLVENEALH